VFGEGDAMTTLLNADQLPAGFEYPREFVRVLEAGLVKLEPWWIMEREEL
jgi:hypothetical protein